MGQNSEKPKPVRLRAVVFYDPYQLYTPTVLDHLNSLRIFSRLEILYAPLAGDTLLEFELDFFDVVIVHYCVRPVFDGLPDKVIDALSNCSAKKVLFCQDEYDLAAKLRKFINEARIDLVFTCVPEAHIASAYPPNQMGNTAFENVLTGYVPLAYIRPVSERRPLVERELVIAHRGRKLPYFYGQLGFEKFDIGRRMREECEKRGIRHDIEWSESHRIYKADWSDFMRSARATLITESGSNCFDEDGDLRAKTNAFLKKHPNADYQQFAKTCQPEKWETDVRMEQISARAFEAIAHGTVLIGFRGEYSGVLKPDLHYICLEKDYSNIDAVFEKLADLEFLEQMRVTAYDDIIASQKWHYARMIELVDAAIERLCNRSLPQRKLVDDEVRIGEMASELLPFPTRLPFRASLSSIPYGTPIVEEAVWASPAKRLINGTIRALPKGVTSKIVKLMPESLKALLRHIVRS